MNVRFDLEIFSDSIPYKMTFIELFSLKEFMFLKFAQWNILILPEYSLRVWICKLQFSGHIAQCYKQCTPDTKLQILLIKFFFDNIHMNILHPTQSIMDKYLFCYFNQYINFCVYIISKAYLRVTKFIYYDIYASLTLNCMWNSLKLSLLYYLVGWLTVEWDDGSRNGYRYGTTDSEKEKYDVQVCNEPRILRNESISSGCQVKRGRLKRVIRENYDLYSRINI